MQQQPTKNVMFKGPHGAFSDGFVWWKRILRATLILLPISSYILARTLSKSDAELDYSSFWMIIYYTIFLTAFLLPMAAPKEIRHLVNDSNLSNKALKKARLFTNGVFMDREADLILDEREKELRMKAYSFSFKASLLIGAITLGLSVNYMENSDFSIIAITTYLFMINLLPCSYIAKHH